MTDAARHNYLKGEPINTELGEVQLDEEGFATNLDDLNTTVDELVEKVPGFTRATAPEKKPAPKQEQKTTEDPDEADKKTAEVIKELLEAGAKTNSEGYIDMEVLNTALKEKNLPPISGGKRKEITDKHVKTGEQQ